MAFQHSDIVTRLRGTKNILHCYEVLKHISGTARLTRNVALQLSRGNQAQRRDIHRCPEHKETRHLVAQRQV